jgi:hypothetical protein
MGIARQNREKEVHIGDHSGMCIEEQNPFSLVTLVDRPRRTRGFLHSPGQVGNRAAHRPTDTGFIGSDSQPRETYFQIAGKKRKPGEIGIPIAAISSPVATRTDANVLG